MYNLSTLAAGSILARFLIYREVSVAEGCIYCLVVLCFALHLALTAYALEKSKQRSHDKEAKQSKPMEDLIKDMKDLQHKVTADTLQKGFRLK